MKILPAILLVILVISCSQNTDSTETAKSYGFFIGSYTESTDQGIYTATLGPLGELNLNGLAIPSTNPSFLDISGDILYAVNETDSGNLSSYFIDKRTMRLFPIDTLENIGSNPCYVAMDVSGFSGYVANYSSGDVMRFEVDNGGRFLENTITVKHQGSGALAQRQSAPHAHSIAPDHRGQVLAADLGTDRIYVYTPDSLSLQYELKMPPGSGPRHWVDTERGDLYILNELNSSIVRASLTDGNYSIISSTSTLPEGFEGNNYPADIHIHPSGSYLYASNRGHNSIVRFRMEVDGSLTEPVWLQQGIDWPRNFAISPDGRHLLVASQRTDQVTSYSLDEEGRAGQQISSIKVHAPVCIEFYP